MTKTCFIDGSHVIGNTWFGWAFVIDFDESGVGYHEVKRAREEHPSPSNNLAEYTALEKCLLFIKEKGFKDVTIQSDSQLVVQQTVGTWHVNAKRLVDINKRCKQLIKETGTRLVQIPREANVADKYTR